MTGTADMTAAGVQAACAKAAGSAGKDAELDLLRQELALLRAAHERDKEAAAEELARLGEQVRTLQQDLDELRGVKCSDASACVERPICAQVFRSVEALCGAACGGLSGYVIDLQGRTLTLDGSFQELPQPALLGAGGKGDAIHSGRYFHLELAGAGTTICNGALELADGVCLLVQAANVTLDGLSITLKSSRTRPVWGAYVRANGAACKALTVKGAALKGCCVWVSNGATCALECTTVKASTRQGVWVSGDGAHVTLNDSIVSKCASHGILVQSGARATLRGSSLDDNDVDGLFCGGSCAADAELCTLRNNARFCAGAFNGGVVTLRRCTLRCASPQASAVLCANGAASRCDASRCKLPPLPWNVEELAGGEVKLTRCGSTHE